MIFVAYNTVMFEPYFWTLSSYAKMHLWWIYPDLISVRNIISKYMLDFIHKYVYQDP
jgi:hypothetical protein